MGCADLFCARSTLCAGKEGGERSEERERRGEFGLSFFPQTIFSLRPGVRTITTGPTLGGEAHAKTQRRKEGKMRREGRGVRREKEREIPCFPSPQSLHGLASSRKNKNNRAHVGGRGSRENAKGERGGRGALRVPVAAMSERAGRNPPRPFELSQHGTNPRRGT
jgi:hypothetical protein